MKKVFFVILGIIISLCSFAQKDSIAVSQMKQIGVYYFEGNNLKQISPIIPEGMKASGGLFKVKASVEFLGEKSDNILENPLEIYVFIPSEYSDRISIKQFRFIHLTPRKGNRKVTTVSGSIFGAKVGAKSQTMEVKKLSDECYKIYLNEPIEEGCYGVFYNYGNGTPYKLYDFDIVNK